MSQLYYGLVTDIGLAKLAASAAGGPSLVLSTMAFGDGAETVPTKAAVELVNERCRAPVVEKYPHPTNPSILYVEGVIPPGVGGWTLREAGIYDADGDLIVIAKPPTMNVALISEGASTEGVVRLPIVFDSLVSVGLLIDPTVLLATQGWVLERVLGRPFITVDSATTIAPPAAPAAHSLYLVPAGATGAWVGQVHKLAYYLGGWGGWRYYAAPVAKLIAASDTGKSFRRTAGGWEELWTEPEVANLLVKSGIAAPHSIDQRLARAVRSQGLNYRTAGGTANALTVALDPPLTAHPTFLPLYVVPPFDVLPGATLNAGYGALPIITSRGNAVRRGDMQGGKPAILVPIVGAWLLVGVAFGDFCPIATNNLLFYVNPAGSNSNDGLSAAQPWATKQFAWETIRDRNDLNGKSAVVRMANGVYAAGLVARGQVLGGSGASSVVFEGDVANLTNVSVSPPAAAAFVAASGAEFSVRGVNVSGRARTWATVRAPASFARAATSASAIYDSRSPKLRTSTRRRAWQWRVAR